MNPPAPLNKASIADGMFMPQAHYHQPWSGYVLVLSDGHIPSVDYYISYRLQALQLQGVQWVHLKQAPSTVTLADGLFVVIVRHCNSAWLQQLKQHAGRLSGVAYMMDDDLPAAWRCQDIPLDYRFWTSWRYWRIQGALSSVCDRIWLSTTSLLEKYRQPTSCLVPPIANVADIRPMTRAGQRWGYHGTRMHHQELKWLLPLVAEVQQQLPDAVFEVFGDRRVVAMFAHIPRVIVLPYQTWPDYIVHCLQSNLAVALAPLLPGRFNAARAMVKVYDMLRCGAAGVFSDQPPYQDLKLAGIPSIAENNHAVWSAWIVRLLNDTDQRQMAYNAMQRWAESELSRQHWSALMSSASPKHSRPQATDASGE